MKELILTRVEKRNALLMALLVLFSNPMWFTWNYRFFYILFFSSLFFLSLVLQKGIKEKASLFTLLIGLLFLSYFGIISTLIGGFQTYVFISAILLFVWPIIKDKEKIKALDYLTTFLSFILGISFVFWFVHTFLFSLPSFGSISYYESKGMNVEIDNFLVFIQVKHDFIIRFYSIFDEPGTIGTLVAFILYGNQYNFKDKRNLALLIATIFTFSLAFYILFVIGLAIQKIKSIKQFLLYSLSLTTIIILLLMFLGENPTFQTVILGRFENLDSSLNSRETHYLDNYYEHFLAGPDFLWGRGRSFFLDNAWLFSGQTYKFFIIEFGLIGTLVLGISYLSLIKKWNMYSVGLLLIFALSFIQRPFALLIWQILLFIILLGRSSIINKKDYGRGI